MQAGAVTGQPLTSSKPFLPQVLSVIAGHLQNARDFAFDRVPAGSPSRGGDVTVYIFCLCQRHKPTELAHSFFFFFLDSVLVSIFCIYGPFNCLSFHKFSRQLSVFSLCSSGLISALLVLSTIYFL